MQLALLASALENDLKNAWLWTQWTRIWPFQLLLDASSGTRRQRDSTLPSVLVSVLRKNKTPIFVLETKREDEAIKTSTPEILSLWNRLGEQDVQHKAVQAH
jgi:hypothetical protein